ncbi:hypothetical protein [Herbaspirillum lusitanum]|uniref:hypothetical protein n=1 Tax=Herbaspirillum lusitanum TaxID=213312 RepID=UPI00030DD613|nr:hypothetical protein [Herbaspirillum lusitanum]
MVAIIAAPLMRRIGRNIREKDAAFDALVDAQGEDAKQSENDCLPIEFIQARTSFKRRIRR